MLIAFQILIDQFAVVTLVLLGRHRGVDTLFDAGWQFEMILENPVSLDADRVAAAIAGPSAQ